MYTDSPYKDIPNELLNRYTLNGKIQVLDWWLDGSHKSGPVIWDESVIKSHLESFSPDNIKKSKGGKVKISNYWMKQEPYTNASKMILESLEKNNIRNMKVAVIGSITPWIEAILLHFNNDITTVEYNVPKCDTIRCISYWDFQKESNLYDCVISYSSIEHSGLGRYGDPLNPESDIETMNDIHKSLKKNGLLLLGVPIGHDALVWNVHRIYGKIRLPLLIEKFTEIEWIPNKKDELLNKKISNNGGDQPVIVLKKSLIHGMFKNDILNINNEIFDIKKNVKTRTVNIHKSEIKYDIYNKNLDNENINYFFLFETPFHDAFAHWIFESVIYIPYLKMIKQKINKNLKLVVNIKPTRNYKDLFFKLFDINKEDIFYIEELYEGSQRKKNSFLPINNICICCRNLTLNNKNINIKHFEKLILNFKNNILNKSQELINIKKNIKYLFFPRNKLQNYKSNDRINNYDCVFKIIKNEKYTEYDTINTVNFLDQIKLILSTENLFLDYGSSLWVNGLFCKNTKIYAVNNLNQHTVWKGWDVIIKIMENNNNKIVFM